MSRRERETESVIGGGATSWPDGVYTLGGGGTGNGSQPEAQGSGDGAGNGSGAGTGAVGKTAWFAPVESSASPDILDFGGCKDGICPVPWASPDNPVFTIQGPPTVLEDNVNHPTHYTDGGIECIEAIEAQLTAEEFRGYLKGNIAKYVWREKHKGGTESLKKAQWYLNRLVSLDEI